MQKPKCRLCGALHYAHEPHTFGHTPKARSIQKLPDFVTKVPRSVPQSELDALSKAMEAEKERLLQEIKALKKELAKRAEDKQAHVASTTRRPVASTAECPTCKARRAVKAAAQKKWRKGSARRPVGESQDFEG